MKKNYFAEHITGDYGVSPKSSSIAIKICNQLVEKYEIPCEQIEIMEDCIVHFYLIGDSKSMTHFHITVEDKNNIDYSIELTEGHNFSINYFQSVNDSIDYLNEFVNLCISGEIFKECSGEYREIKRA